MIHKVKEFGILDSIHWVNKENPHTTRFSVNWFPTRNKIRLKREDHGGHHDKHPEVIEIRIKELRELIKNGSVHHRSF